MNGNSIRVVVKTQIFKTKTLPFKAENKTKTLTFKTETKTLAFKPRPKPRLWNLSLETKTQVLRTTSLLFIEYYIFMDVNKSDSYT
jgi:hypothetical protein